MHFITPVFAVGNRADAENAETLATHRIDAVLSLAPIARPAGIVSQLSMDVADRVALPVAAIQEAVGFLQAQTRLGRRVLVHCEMGISRSPSIAVAYLHEALGMPIDEALQLIQAKNPFAEPHPLLLASIRAHYRKPAVVDLSGNENPLGPSPKAVEAIQGAIPQLHRYPDKDATVLRDKLAARLDVDQEQVMLGNGSCELIDHLARACLSEGDEALIPVPTFPAYRSAAIRAGATVVSVPMPDGFYQVENFLERVTSRTKLVMIGTPHNPTGTILGEKELEQLIQGLPERVWVLIDEAYIDYVPEGDMADALAWIAKGRNVVVLRSLSKVHGLAGLRIGYGVAPVGIAKALDSLRQHYNTSSLAQIAAVAALDDEDHMARTYANNKAQLEALQRGLDELGASYVPSRANFVLVQAAGGMVERLEQMGVKVKAMARYGAPECIRVSVGLPEENARFLEAFAQALEESAEMNNQTVFA